MQVSRKAIFIYLWMVGTQNQPAEEQIRYVQKESTHYKAKHTGHGLFQSDEENVGLVKVAEISQATTPLSKHSKAQDNTGGVHQCYGVWVLYSCLKLCE